MFHFAPSKRLLVSVITCFLVCKASILVTAQTIHTVNPSLQRAINTDTTVFVPAGKFSALAFGDIYYKSHSDSLNRGGANQYTGINQTRNGFQFRRIYLGYNYSFTKSLSAEILLAAEDNIATNTGTTSGDLLSDNKLGFFVKLLNVRWKNIWKGADLVIGQSPTPSFTLLTEKIWRYRSVEKTIADIRKTPSFDLGLAIQGVFDSQTKNFGYNLMVANGTGDKPETDDFKKFYGDVYAKFFGQKLIIDLYADYERLNWTPNWHHSRNMLKAMLAYNTPSFTIGAEGFINQGKNDFAGIHSTSQDTTSGNALGLSLYTHGRIIENKLRYFARIDFLNPDEQYDAARYSKYTGMTSTYEPNTKEQFIILGLDFTPEKNVHFMPNIWYTRYNCQQAGLKGAAKTDYDLVYRLTFFVSFNR